MLRCHALSKPLRIRYISRMVLKDMMRFIKHRWRATISFLRKIQRFLIFFLLHLNSFWFSKLMENPIDGNYQYNTIAMKEIKPSPVKLRCILYDTVCFRNVSEETAGTTWKYKSRTATNTQPAAPYLFLSTPFVSPRFYWNFIGNYLLTGNVRDVQRSFTYLST